MSGLSVCRICLAGGDIRLKTIRNTPHHAMYEKFTGAKLTGDGKPETVCYLCSSLLRRFTRYYKMSQAAEKYLAALLRNESPEATNPQQQNLHNLTLMPVQSLTLTDPVLRGIPIKEEPPLEPPLAPPLATDVSNGSSFIKEEPLETDVSNSSLIEEMENTGDHISNELKAENCATTDNTQINNVMIAETKIKADIEIAEVTDGEGIPAVTDREDIAAVTDREDIAAVTDREDIVAVTDREDIVAVTDREDIAAVTNREDIAAVTDREDIAAVTDREDIAVEIEINDTEAILDDSEGIRCDECKKKFNFAHQLKLHKRLHLLHARKTTGNICAHCNKKFNKTSSLSLHLLKVHNKVYNKTKTEKNTKVAKVNSKKKDKVFECKRCKINFTNETDLVKHVISHTSPQVVIEKVMITELTKCKKIDFNSDKTEVLRNTRTSRPRLAKRKKN